MKVDHVELCLRIQSSCQNSSSKVISHGDLLSLKVDFQVRITKPLYRYQRDLDFVELIADTALSGKLLEI